MALSVVVLRYVGAAGLLEIRSEVAVVVVLLS